MTHLPATVRPRKRRAIGPVLLLAVLLLAPAIVPHAVAAPSKAVRAMLPAHADGILLVGYDPASSPSDRAAIRASARVQSARQLSPLAPDAERWVLPSEADLGPALSALARDPRVRFAEPDWKVTAAVDSNDSYYTNGSLWGMHGDSISPGANQYGTGADEAWRAGFTGSRDVYVGVIDEGIQFTHPDLAANIWTNPIEATGATGVDDDRNGYVDDLHGWDFYNRDAGIYDAGADSHGTHVSGTIGGLGGNGAGVAGVNWAVTIISGKFLGPGGGYISDAVLATDYLTDLKTRHGLNLVATSNSWGGGGFSQAMLDAIDRGGDRDILFVAAAGNSTSNNDATDNYPSNYRCTKGGSRGWDCVIAVAAIDAAGAIAYFSSYGATTVDIGAPGVDVYSSLPTDTYGSYSGTSMATPHVSGAVALCASITPAASARSRKEAILNSARATASLAGRTVTGGRLDVGAMVGLCLPAAAPVNGAPSSLAVTSSDIRSVSLTWVDGSSNESSFEIQRGPAGGACSSWTVIGDAPMDSTSYVAGGLDPSTDYCFQVRARNSYGGGSYSATSNGASGRTADAPPPYVCSPTTYGWVGSVGANLGLTDDASSYLAIGFPFTHYGTAYTALNVSSNGFVRLGSNTAWQYTNTPLPSTAEPTGIIAAAWDDWNPGAGGTVTAQTVGSSPTRRFVATWDAVPPYGLTGTATFQVILEEGSNAFVLQYADMLIGSTGYDYGTSATAGTEDATGLMGTQISYNSRSLMSGTAIRCTAGSTQPLVVDAVLPSGTVGATYATALAAQGGKAPYTWRVESGTLPKGLVLGSNGAISGTPETTGTSAFTVRVSGSDGEYSVASRSIAVATPVAVTASTLTFTAGASGSGAAAATGGTGSYTWALASGASLPAGLSLASNGTLSGTPAASGSYPVSLRATDGAGRTATGTVTLSVAFGKLAPANTVKYSNKTTSVALSWSAHGGATLYRWCVATSTTCSTWTTTSATSASTSVARGTTYYWQAAVCTANCGTQTPTWATANGATYWRFSIAR